MTKIDLFRFCLTIIAAIEEPTVIDKILAHLGLPTRHLRYAIPASLAVQPVPSCTGVRASYPGEFCNRFYCEQIPIAELTGFLLKI